MSVATSTAIGLAAAIGGATSIGSAAIGSHAAGQAAKTQAQAAQSAEQLQAQEFAQQQQNLAPYLAAGKGALSQLQAGTQPGGQFAQTNYPAFTPTGLAATALQPGTFQAPTAAQAAATPGYQFAFDQGLQALQRSQAATGITGGGAAKAAQQYGQGLASTNYQQAYANALNSYGTNQAAAQGALGAQSGVYGTNFGVQQQMLQNAYNRIAGIAGMGAGAASQANQAAQNYAAQQGNLLTSAGAAQAAGTMGQANAWAQGLGGVGNAAMNAAILSKLFGQPSTPFNPGQDTASAAQQGDIAMGVLGGLPQASVGAAPFVSSALPELGSAYTAQLGSGLNSLLVPGSSFGS